MGELPSRETSSIENLHCCASCYTNCLLELLSGSIRVLDSDEFKLLIMRTNALLSRWFWSVNWAISLPIYYFSWSISGLGGRCSGGYFLSEWPSALLLRGVPKLFCFPRECLNCSCSLSISIRAFLRSIVLFYNFCSTLLYALALPLTSFMELFWLFFN